MSDVAIRLLKRAGTPQTIRVASKNYQFKGGQATPVPPNVAEICLAKKNERGGKLFERVDDEIARVDKEICGVLGVQFEWKTKW